MLAPNPDPPFRFFELGETSRNVATDLNEKQQAGNPEAGARDNCFQSLNAW